jgi:hypothetical protein
MSIDKLQQELLEKIKSGKIAKRPRLYFVLQSLAIGALAFVTLALSIFVLSFIVFSVHESGEQFLLGFGSRGLLTFIALFPWYSLALLIALMGILEWLPVWLSHAYTAHLRGTCGMRRAGQRTSFRDSAPLLLA